MAYVTQHIRTLGNKDLGIGQISEREQPATPKNGGISGFGKNVGFGIARIGL